MWYDPELGRFISEDPAADPDNPNLYSYGVNNPVTRIDPSGEASWNIFETLASLGNGIANGLTAWMNGGYFWAGFYSTELKIGAAYNDGKWSLMGSGYGEEDYKDGSLTPKQLKASIWLHQYIQMYVQKNYNYTIPLNRHQVIGHYEIDPINKWYCPGKLFPWESLMNKIAN